MTNHEAASASFASPGSPVTDCRISAGSGDHHNRHVSDRCRRLQVAPNDDGRGTYDRDRQEAEQHCDTYVAACQQYRNGD